MPCQQAAQQHADSDPEAPEPALAAEEIRVRATCYTSVQAALESDHKPVLAALSVSIPVTDQVSCFETNTIHGQRGN